ncbi:sensor domain-containing diguanylate cyclase [Azospirillum sp. SYSU D00513]|uniref:sensor domain-containing diguanylate cyclase n=1 Tax=Azospirillum sp. SYSU D00513 TaxID=2812561 RepID=UPI001A9771EE|nr:sensor domain-containing diguanylate cyclase [Azospirillum sp. SYSU D00513]
MPAAPKPTNETERLASLRRMLLLSSPAEEMLDCVTRSAHRMVGEPFALITLVDENRQWFKSRVGLDAGETPRDLSFCAYAILGEEMLVVPDAREDARFADNALVLGPPFLRSYAGMPLKNAEGHSIGTLCLSGVEPRAFTAADLQAIRDLARLAEMALENRRLGETQMQLLAELDEARRDALMCTLAQVWNRRGFEALYAREAAKCAREGTPLALVAIDIDRFKAINDTHGHGVGDRVIRMLADILRGSTRGHDIIARVGGEEFLLLMPGIALEETERVGAKLVQAVRDAGLIPLGPDAAEPRRFTISLGILSIDPQAAPGARDLALARADEALYAAKHGGRDRAVLAEPVGEPVPAAE